MIALCAFFQSFKRKPGQADNERSMGDHSQPVQKRLRTMESSGETEQTPVQPKQNIEKADAFEHIKQGSEFYDAQTYGMHRVCKASDLIYVMTLNPFQH